MSIEYMVGVLSILGVLGVLRVLCTANTRSMGSTSGSTLSYIFENTGSSDSLVFLRVLAAIVLVAM